jgi:DNA-directed RNA polymerase specialized sigma24 family protein
MGICENKHVRVVKTSLKPAKAPPKKLPWPRVSPDDPTIHLGVDVENKIQDITKIVHKYFRVADISMEELLQEVFVAIIHKNHTKSAHDPRKSSFGHYVYMIANNVCINLVHRKKRHDREKDSIDAPIGADDFRTMLDILENHIKDDEMDSHLRDVENVMRRRGYRDLARYMRAVRSGASPDVIREALSWYGHKISNKSIINFRLQIKTLVLDIYKSNENGHFQLRRL